MGGIANFIGDTVSSVVDKADNVIDSAVDAVTDNKEILAAIALAYATGGTSLAAEAGAAEAAAATFGSSTAAEIAAAEAASAAAYTGGTGLSQTLFGSTPGLTEAAIAEGAVPVANQGILGTGGSFNPLAGSISNLIPSEPTDFIQSAIQNAPGQSAVNNATAAETAVAQTAAQNSAIKEGLYNVESANALNNVQAANTAATAPPSLNANNPIQSALFGDVPGVSPAAINEGAVSVPTQGYLGVGGNFDPLQGSLIPKTPGEYFNTALTMSAVGNVVGGLQTTEQKINPKYITNTYTGPQAPKTYVTQATIEPLSTRYEAAKQKVSRTVGTPTNVGLLAVNNSPFYDFLKANNLNRGIL